MVSLDSPDEGRSDDLINLRKGSQTEKVKRNIQLAKDYRREHSLQFDFAVNSVIFLRQSTTPGHVRFCLQNDFTGRRCRISLSCPCLVWWITRDGRN